MEKKKKKRLTMLVLILAGLVLVALLVYFVINLVFSIFTNSFYESVVTTEEVQTAAEPTAVPSGGQEETPEEQTPQTAPPLTAKTDGDALFKSLSVDKLNLTAEEFKEIQKKIPFADKVAVLNILSTGLSAAEYKELIGMLGSGITSSEVRRAYQILSKGLSSENKAKIWGYYNKYVYLIQ